LIAGLTLPRQQTQAEGKVAQENGGSTSPQEPLHIAPRASSPWPASQLAPFQNKIKKGSNLQGKLRVFCAIFHLLLSNPSCPISVFQKTYTSVYHVTL